MGGTTGSGLPFPLGTDFTVNGDNAIKALAETVDGRIGTVIDCQTTATISIPSGQWSAIPVTMVAERDPGNLIHSDVNSPITDVAAWWDILAWTRWNSAATGRRLVGWHTSTAGNPGTFAQSAIPAVAGLLSHAHRDIASIPAASRIALWVFQDSGAAVSVTAGRIVARYMSGTVNP
jgi:hypothetical protein